MTVRGIVNDDSINAKSGDGRTFVLESATPRQLGRPDGTKRS